MKGSSKEWFRKLLLMVFALALVLGPISPFTVALAVVAAESVMIEGDSAEIIQESSNDDAQNVAEPTPDENVSDEAESDQEEAEEEEALLIAIDDAVIPLALTPELFTRDVPTRVSPFLMIGILVGAIVVIGGGCHAIYTINSKLKQNKKEQD